VKQLFMGGTAKTRVNLKQKWVNERGIPCLGEHGLSADTGPECHGLGSLTTPTGCIVGS